MTQRGEIWRHNPEDILLSIPNFAPEDLVRQVDTTASTISDADALVRLRMMRELETFDRRISIKENKFARQLAKLYSKVRAPDPNQWTQISIAEITKSISTSKEEAEDVVSQVAVHKLLMLDPLHFAAQELHASSMQFSARPQKEIENIQRVIEWIRRDSKELSGFIERANKIIPRALDLRKEKSDVLPQRSESQMLQFSPSDRRIIDFLRCSIRKHSAHQPSPYDAFAPTIIKRLDFYKKDITRDVIFNFLQDIGVLEPWSDPILLTEERVISEGQVLTNVPRDGPKLTEDPLDHIRHDWGQLPVYVIDAADAEELDDGISIEKVPDGTNWVHVHVADPTSQLSRTDPITLTAATRGCTIYGPQQTFPMLPSEFTMKTHSLGAFDAEKGQNVLTFSTRVDAKGHIIESTVRAGIIRNVHVLTYTAVERSWGVDIPYVRWPFGDALTEVIPRDVPSEARDDLTALRDISVTQIEKRVEAGRYSWFIDKPKAIFPDKPLPSSDSIPQLWSGYPKLVYGVESGNLSPARAMVAEAMILAGQCAGSFCNEKGVPGLFRSAGEPVGSFMDKKDDFRSFNGRVPLEIAAKAMVARSPASYSTIPADHWPLNVQSENGGYIRVTSPLRRFSDMVMHWQIKSALLREKHPAISLQEMGRYASQLHEREYLVNRVIRAQNGYWAAVFMQRRLRRHPEEMASLKLDGYAFTSPEFETYSREYNTQVLIPELGLKGWLTTDKVPHWDLGDKIPVHISDVTMVGKAKVRLEIAT